MKRFNGAVKDLADTVWAIPGFSQIHLLPGSPFSEG